MTAVQRFAVYVLACAAAMGAVSSAPAFAGPKLDDWATLKNERHGFAIAYPVDVFEQKAAPTTDEGRVLQSKDGKAKSSNTSSNGSVA